MVFGYLERPDKEAHLALGEFLSAWSELELSLEVMFEVVSDLGEAGSMAYTQLTFKSKVELFESWLDKHSSTDPRKDGAIQDLKKLIRQISVLGQKRNRIVHAVWTELNGVWCRLYIDVMHETYALVSSRHYADQSFRDKNIFSVGKMRVFSKDCYRLIDELRSIYDALRPVSELVIRLREQANNKQKF